MGLRTARSQPHLFAPKTVAGPPLGCLMTRVMVTKVVNSFGSTWARVRPQDEVREIFNASSFYESTDFSSIEVGQEVEFDERPDQANGTSAQNLVLAVSLPS